MKKFLQNSCQWLVMLCAMFAMSVSAMAQDYATVTSVSPVAGEIKLDDNEYGTSQITITMDGVWDADVYAESVEAVAAKGIVFTAPDGCTSAPRALYMWGGYDNIAIQFPSADPAFKTPGTYTLYVPANLNTISGKGNPELTYTWTVLPKSTFEFSRNGIEATGEQGSNPWGPMKSLTGFKVAVPEGVTLANVPASVSVNVSVDQEEAAAVICAVVLADGYLTFTFPTAYNEKCYVSAEVPAEAFTTTDGLKSKAFSASLSVDPNTYFDLSMNAVECESPLTSFDITLPEGLTADIVGESFKYSYWQDGNHEGSVTVTSHSQSGNVLTINFAEDVLPLDVWFTVEFEGGFVVATDGSISYRLSVDNNKVTAPVFFAIGTSDPANGATLSLDNGTVSSVSFTTGESFAYIYDDNVPETITCKDAENNEVKVNTIVGWDYTLNFNFLSSIDKAGVYTLTIPAGSYQINGKNLPATTVTFTVTAKTHFGFNEWNVTPRTNGSYTSIESIVLPVPDGVTFADGTETVTISVNNVDEDVEATFDATEKTITLAWEAAEVGTYVVNIPEGTFTSTEGLKNNELGLGYEIIPTLALNELAVDAEGNYWTSFAFDYNYTLPEGYTPYKVVGISNTGSLTVEEIVGTAKTDDVDVVFNDNNGGTITDISSNTFTVLDGKVSVTYTLGSSSLKKSISNGYYIDCNGTPTTFTLTVLDSSVEIGSFKFLGWSCDYTDGYSSFDINGSEIVIVSNNYSYIGGLRIGLATGEYNAPILPANAGILVKAAEASEGVEYTKTNNTATADMTGNLLVGCTESATWNETDKTYYKFSLDADNTPGSAGFYWGVDGGASIEAHAGKAYLVLDATPSSNSRYLINGVTTGIDAIAAESTEAIFNLQGQRVVAPKAGVYVKNGKKIIVK